MLGSHCRAIRYERHNWPFVADRGTSLTFKVWIPGDASRYVLIRFAALWWDMVTIGQLQVTWTVTIWSPVPIRSHNWVSIITIWDDRLRANTLRYVHHEPMRYVAIGYDCGRDVFDDHDRGWSRFELQLDPDGSNVSEIPLGLWAASENRSEGFTILYDPLKAYEMYHFILFWNQLLTWKYFIIESYR
jgi:hypothetical protein